MSRVLDRYERQATILGRSPSPRAIADVEQLAGEEIREWSALNRKLSEGGEPQASFITGTNTELIYASTATGIAKNTFTAETALNDEATMGPQAYLPAGFWLPSKTSLGRGIRVRARGIVSSTLTPSYTWTLRLGASEAAAAGPIVLGSAALATASGISNVFWDFEGDIILEGVGTTSGTSTLRGIGTLTMDGYAVAATTRAFRLWGGAASPGTVATGVLKAASFVTLNITCTASSASNTITLQQLLVYGLN